MGSSTRLAWNKPLRCPVLLHPITNIFNRIKTKQMSQLLPHITKANVKCTIEGRKTANSKTVFMDLDSSICMKKSNPESSQHIDMFEVIKHWIDSARNQFDEMDFQEGFTFQIYFE